MPIYPPRGPAGDVTETEAWCDDCMEVTRFSRRPVIPSPERAEQPDTRPVAGWLGERLSWVCPEGHVRDGLVERRGYDVVSGTEETERAGPAGVRPGDLP